MAWYLWVLLLTASHTIVYFAGANNPWPSVKKKLTAAAQAELDKLKLGIKTDATNLTKKL